MCKTTDYIYIYIYISVGIATRYEMDGPGIETGCGRKFAHLPDRRRAPPSLLWYGYRVSFPGVNRPGCDVDHKPASSVEVVERVELPQNEIQNGKTNKNMSTGLHYGRLMDIISVY
jgi:hypothetical protein